MELKEAVRMILLESAAHPKLLKVARPVYDDLEAGRQVPYQALSAVLEEASGAGVIATLKKQNPNTFEDMVLTLGREIDRQAPVGGLFRR
ncbi:MAG: hypothetical protein GEV03_05290 [Streptosporangiales bacterium]|nr:hypothetical protein [Streptosporangiales bacterium]